MCEKCVELDEKIEHCRRLRDAITDSLAIEGISALIESYAEERRRLHPELDD